MNHIKELGSLSRLFLVVFAGLLSACTSDYWPNRPQSSTSGQAATQPPMALLPASSEQVARAQTLLTELGFAPGPADGQDGPQTASAVRVYQSSASLATDGRVSTSLLAHLTAASERRQVVSAQSKLAALGYYPGPVDGQAGPRIRSAVMAFQEAEGWTPDGQIDAALLAALDSAGASVGDTATTEPADEPVIVEAEAPAAAETATETATSETEEVVAEAETPPSEASASEATAAEAMAVDSTAAETVAEVQDKAEEIAALEPEPRHLEAGDRVQVNYLGAKQKPLELEVAEDGTIALPDAGSVQAAGLGVDELRDKVMVKLIESYMDDVEINVDLAGTGDQAVDADGKTLAPGDLVLVSLAGATAVSYEVEVASNGSLDVPEVGSIQASGLGLKELKKEINVKLLESYMRKLYVSVEQLP